MSASKNGARALSSVKPHLKFLENAGISGDWA